MSWLPFREKVLAECGQHIGFVPSDIGTRRRATARSAIACEGLIMAIVRGAEAASSCSTLEYNFESVTSFTAAMAGTQICWPTATLLS